MKKLFLAVMLLCGVSWAQQPVVPGSILGSLTPITSSNGTLNATFSVVSGTGVPAVLVQLDQTTTITAGAIRFQVSYDGTNFVNTSTDAVTDPTSATNATISMPYTLQASTNKAFAIQMKGAQAVQILESTAMTGTGAITPYYSALPAFNATSFNLNSEAGTAITNTPTAIGTKGSGNVMSVNSDLTSIAGTATVAAAAGVQKVGMVGNAGAAVDAAGVNAVAPANDLIVGGEYSGAASTILTAVKTSPLSLTQSGALMTQQGGVAVQIWNAQAFTGLIGTTNLILSSSTGTLGLTFSSTTGSPSGCTVSEAVSPFGAASVNTVWSGSVGNLASISYSFPVNPTNSGFNDAGTSLISFILQCSVYPSGGTVTAGFTTSQAVNIAGANGNAALVNSSGQLSTQANLYDAAGNGITTNSSTYSSKFALDGNFLGTLGTAFSSAGKVDVKAADGDLATLGAKADAKSTSTDTTAVSAISVLKEISAMEQAPASQAVTNAGTFAVQAAESDGANVTLGAKADAKSTSTDTTAITAMQVLKEISAMEQAPASRAVTNAGTFAVQDTLQAGTAIVGKFGIDQTTPGTTNAIEQVPDTSTAVALSNSVKLTVTSSVSVKASAGNVYGLSANNGAAAVCWVQFTNSAGAGTLGSAVIFSVVMPASGTVTIPPGALALGNFSTGITVGIASVTNSSSACGTAGNVTVFYK